MNNNLADLHVHLYGCLTPEDIWHMARDIEIDSNKIDLFSHNYQKVFGRPSNYEKYWMSSSGIENIAKDYLVTSRSNFQEFQAKFDLVPALFPLNPHAPLVLSHVIDKHQKEGVTYVEYRCFMPPYFNKEELRKYLDDLTSVCLEKETLYQSEIKPRLVMSLPRDPKLFRNLYLTLHQWLQQNPARQSFIVGIDLCALEANNPPKNIQQELAVVAKNNIIHPESALSILYHVGEQYDHISLCSSLRWVYEAVTIGANRLGHAAILGLDSNLLIDTEGEEPVSERIDHISWVLENSYWLSDYGIQPNSSQLRNELENLKNQPSTRKISLYYNQEYLEQFDQLQNALLKKLSTSPVVIESCPTSNSVLTDAPLNQSHPLVKFKKNGLNVTIGSDDPGIFNCSLSSELKLAESLIGPLESSERYYSKTLLAEVIK